MIDLGVWASEGYAIPDATPTDELLDDLDNHH